MIEILNEEIIKYNNLNKSYYDEDFFNEFVGELENNHVVELKENIQSYMKNGQAYHFAEQTLIIDNIVICINPFKKNIKCVLYDILEQLEIEEEIICLSKQQGI